MSSKTKNEASPTFETSLEQLEAIVSEMEDGNLPLETLLVRYEEGTKLLKQCDLRLKEAEQKIEILRSKSGDEPEFEEFDPSA